MERIVIVAPPGVGKSRLLGEFAGRAEESGTPVLRARVRAGHARPSRTRQPAPAGRPASSGDGASREAAPMCSARRLPRRM